MTAASGRWLVPATVQPVTWWAIGLAAFVLLDYLTFNSRLAPLGVTPWNPSIGLAIAIVLHGGLRFGGLLVAAPLASELLVRALPVPLWLSVLEALLVGLGYWLAVYWLLRGQTFERNLRRVADFLRLAAALALGATVVAVTYNLALVVTGYLPGGQLIESAVRYWIGEMIGILVVTPFCLIVAQRRDWPRVSSTSVMQGAAILAVVAVVFGATTQPRLHLSFLLIIPIIWTAVRDGYEGASAGLLLLQISIMSILPTRSDAVLDVVLLQAIMLILALSGLAIGLLVDERSEHEQRLREQREALAHAARLDSLGGLASAIAHELNQPLTAAGNYARVSVAALKEDAPRLDVARQAVESMIAQVERSAEVMRRLRALIRSGEVAAVPYRVDRLCKESVDLIRPLVERRGILVTLDVAPTLPLAAVDVVQIQQVLTNLIRNAAEALEEHAVAQPEIIIAAGREGDRIQISVTDNGPGFPEGFDIATTPAFGSSKRDGLGIGLSLCQSIVAAHGGRLQIVGGHSGARVAFTLPIASRGA